MPVFNPPLLDAIRAKKSITPEDILALRREIFHDGAASRAEVEAVFDLNNSCVATDAKVWVDFFAEIVACYLVFQDTPYGYVTPEEADWLIASINQDGRVDAATELPMLLHVLDKAVGVPPQLKTYGLKLVFDAIVKGDALTVNGKKLTPEVVDDGEIDVLKTILYAPSADGGVNISDEEANLLFALDAATREADNAPRWPILFANALSQHFLGFFPEMPRLEQAQKHDAWLKDAHKPRAAGFLARIGEALLSGAAFKAVNEQTDWEARAQESNRLLQEAEQFTQAETQALKKLLWQDGKLSLAERALLDKLRTLRPDQAATIDSLLQP